MTLARAAVLPALVALAACATPAPDRPPPETPADGAIVLLRNDVVDWNAVYSRDRVARGRPVGPYDSWLDRTGTGTWRGSVLASSPESLATGMSARVVELSVSGDRITGPGTDVTVTWLPEGFRLEGIWMKEGVRLEVLPEAIQAQEIRFVRKVWREYAREDAPVQVLRLAGQAAQLDASQWPQLQLSFLVARVGVRPNRRGKYG